MARRVFACSKSIILRRNHGSGARVIGEVMGSRAAAAGGPWVSAFDPQLLQQQLLDLGFSEAETYTPNVLNRRYLYRRKDGLRTGGADE